MSEKWDANEAIQQLWDGGFIRGVRRDSIEVEAILQELNKAFTASTIMSDSRRLWRMHRTAISCA